MEEQILRREGENILNEAGENVARFEANNIIGNFGGGSSSYSLEERIVGKWIDNNNIYEKTLSINHSTSEIDVSDLDISLLIDLKGIANDQGNLFIPSYAEGSAFYLVIWYNIADKTLHISKSSDRIELYYVTIRYTKNN